MTTETKKKHKNTKTWILDSSTKPRNHSSCTPPNMREFVDYDYLGKLTEEETIWLAQFTDAYMTGKKNDVSKEWSHEKFLESYGRNNRRTRDVYNQMNPMDLDQYDNNRKENIKGEEETKEEETI